MPAERLVKNFGEESFDAVIATDLLEHVKDWQAVVSNIKRVVRKGGHIYITTRSHGFPYHDYPHDFWRYEVKDMKKIFSDCEILALEKDKLDAGVFIKVRKPKNFKELNLSNFNLYSIIFRKRVNNVIDKGFLYRIYLCRALLLERISKIKQSLLI